MSASIARTSLHALMAGALFVAEVEVPESKLALAIPDARPSFLRMPFQEAVDAFLRRGIVTREEWEAMSDTARLRAFYAADLASRNLAERARQLIETALREGMTLSEFQARMTPDDLGVTAANPSTLETIYRTNTQLSYGQGRLQQMERPAVLNARPLRQYRTAGDSRVRPRHRALNGLVFNAAEDGGWRRYAPPLGINCRCSMVTRREDQVQGQQRVESTELDAAGLGPDPGWSGPGA